MFCLPSPMLSFAMQKIRACDSPKEDLLGSDPCAWGPRYWCKNMATAVECNVSVGCVPSPGSAGSWESPSPPTISPRLSRRPSSTAGVTYGTRSLLPGCLDLPAALVQDPGPLPLGCARIHGRRRQEPTGLTTPAGTMGDPSHLCLFLLHPWGLDFQIRLRDSSVFSGLEIQPLRLLG